MFLLNKRTMIQAAIIAFGTLKVSYSAEQQAQNLCFSQKTTVLACDCAGDVFGSIISDIHTTFPGTQKIVDLTPDKKNWVIAESDNFVIQNIEDPFVVKSGENLPATGFMFKQGLTIPHVTVIGPESSWWKPETKEIPMEKLLFSHFSEDVKKIESLAFSIDSIGILGRWFVLNLKPTASTTASREIMIEPYTSVRDKYLKHDLPAVVQEIINELEVLPEGTMEAKKAFVIEKSKNLWECISDLALEYDDAFASVLALFEKLSKKNISPYAYGFWFNEDQHPLSSSVISLMKVLTPWKAHLSLMPILGAQDSAIGEIIKQENQRTLLTAPEHLQNMEKLTTLVEQYKGQTIQFKTLGISHAGVLTVQELI